MSEFAPQVEWSQIYNAQVLEQTLTFCSISNVFVGIAANAL